MKLAEMLKPENVRVVSRVSSWQEAIRLAIRPLQESGWVEPRYAEAIIKATDKSGPYYILTEDVALIHGRPEDGVISGQLAVTVLREPICFSADTFKVRLLVALAAEDADAHLESMRVLAGIFMDADAIARIIALDDAAAIYQAFMAAEEAEQASKGKE